MEFKVGDRVRIIHDELFMGVSFVGKIGVITRVDEDDPDGYPYKVQVEDVPIPYWVGRNDIEKVEEAA